MQNKLSRTASGHWELLPSLIHWSLAQRRNKSIWSFPRTKKFHSNMAGTSSKTEASRHEISPTRSETSKKSSFLTEVCGLNYQNLMSYLALMLYERSSARF